jgi:hypothetical protein
VLVDPVNIGNNSVTYNYDYPNRLWYATFIGSDGLSYGLTSYDPEMLKLEVFYRAKIADERAKNNRIEQEPVLMSTNDLVFLANPKKPYIDDMKEHYTLPNRENSVFPGDFVSPAWSPPPKTSDTLCDTYKITEPVKTNKELYEEYYWRFVNSKDWVETVELKAQMLEYVTSDMEPAQDDSWVDDPVKEQAAPDEQSFGSAVFGLFPYLMLVAWFIIIVASHV